MRCAAIRLRPRSRALFRIPPSYRQSYWTCDESVRSKDGLRAGWTSRCGKVFCWKLAWRAARDAGHRTQEAPEEDVWDPRIAPTTSQGQEYSTKIHYLSHVPTRKLCIACRQTLSLGAGENCYQPTFLAVISRTECNKRLSLPPYEMVSL